MDLSLKGKRGVATGGSRGIGKAIALALAEEGVSVVRSGAHQLSQRTANCVVPVIAGKAVDRMGNRSFGRGGLSSSLLQKVS